MKVKSLHHGGAWGVLLNETAGGDGNRKHKDQEQSYSQLGVTILYLIIPILPFAFLRIGMAMNEPAD